MTNRPAKRQKTHPFYRPVPHLRADLGPRCYAWVLTALVVLAPGLCAGSATGDSVNTAAAEASGELTEIIVTAERREERLQDVPISVTAFTQESIDQLGLRSIDDLTRLSPGVSFQRNGISSSQNYNDENTDINIRGIDSQAGASTVGIYVDDTPIQTRHILGSVNAFPALFDLDRVEVLRGPQGTLFGAGAEGGVVRFITPQPSLTGDSGYIRTELSTTENGDASYELGVAAGGPIVDNVLGFRVSASFRRDGGWVDRASYSLSPPTDTTGSTAFVADVQNPIFNRITQPDANWQQTDTIRAALKWQVNDKVAVTPSFYYQQLHLNDTSAYWVSLSDPAANQFYNGNQLQNESHDPFSLSAIRVDWNLGFAQLVSNTSYFWRNQTSTSDYTQFLGAAYAASGLLPSIYPQSANDVGYSPFQDDQRNFYQEFRLNSPDSSARIVWNAGLYYSHLNENVPQYIYDTSLEQNILNYSTQQGYPTDICAPPVPCPNGDLYYTPVDRVVDQQTALFGEVALKVTDSVKATVGLRVSKVEYTGTVVQGGAFLGTPSTVWVASGSETPVTPKFVLSWQPDRDDLLYLSAAKGYRVGGTNSGVGTTCGTDLAALGLPVGPNGMRQAPLSYASDSLWSYEIGSKNTLLNRRLTIDSSLFVINWSNIQQNVYLPDCGNEFTANLGKVQSRGGDIAIQFLPIDNLSLGLTLAYTDARYTKYSCAGILQFTGSGLGCGGPTAPAGGVAPIVSEGDRLVGAPWTILASAEQTFANWSGRKPYVRADFQFTTAQTALLPGQDERNALFDSTIPGLPITRNLSLRAGFRWSGYDVSMFVNNALDQNPTLFESRDIASPPNSVQGDDRLYFARGVRPRTLGVTATYRY
jgi:iron complex outermembrane recepter protein